jgi:hypothetical protein
MLHLSRGEAQNSLCHLLLFPAERLFRKSFPATPLKSWRIVDDIKVYDYFIRILPDSIGLPKAGDGKALH